MKDGDFASMFEDAASNVATRKSPKLKAGTQVEGTVLEVSGGLVIVDVGGSADATIDLLEFSDRPVKVGDSIRATVSNARADAPVLTLSLGRGGGSLNTESLRLAYESSTPVTGTVSEAVKGGFSIDLAGARAFCPISQIDTSYVTEPEVYLNQSYDFTIIEFKENGRNLIVSRRKLLDEERKAAQAAAVADLKVGAVVSGTVKSTVRHGAVVSIGGLDGFVHISELSRARVERPEDVVSIGEDVEAKVISIEEGDRGLSIRLSLKALQAGDASKGPSADDVLTAKVVRHVGNGLIVSTSHGDGLVPTRELALPPGADHKRTYPIGHELEVVLVSRDNSTGKMRFSVERVAQVEERKNVRDFGGQGGSGASLGSLGDLMKEKFGHLAASPSQSGGTASQSKPAPRAAASLEAQPAEPAKPAKPARQPQGVTRRRKD